VGDIYGIKVSSKEYDVNNCPDHQLIFSSEFPLLKIAFQGSFTIADCTKDVTIIDHNLGYPPAFWVFQNNNYNQDFFTNGSSMNLATNYPIVNSNKLQWLGSTLGAPAGSFTGYYYIFYHNLTSFFNGVTLQSGGTSKDTEKDFGIKISLPGKDISSKDYRDFSINSDCKTPIIHKSGYFTDNIYPAAPIPHNLGYEPMAFIYFNDINGIFVTPDYPADAWFLASPLTDLSSYTADSVNVYTGYGTDLNIAYLILKDPFI